MRCSCLPRRQEHRRDPSDPFQRQRKGLSRVVVIGLVGKGLTLRMRMRALQRQCSDSSSPKSHYQSFDVPLVSVNVPIVPH
jgi:hypothetical protein